MLVNADTINVHLNDEPFLSSYNNESKVYTGIAIDILNLLFKETDDKFEIVIEPVARIKQAHLQGKNKLFISLIKNQTEFKNEYYIGSISHFPINIYKFKSKNDIKLTNINNLRNYSFGVVRKGSRHNYFKSLNFVDSYKHHIVSSDKQNILRFFIGRTDLLIENPMVLKYFAKKENIDLTLVESLMTIDDLSGDIGIFFSESTDFELVEKYQQALSNLKNTDRYKTILKRYGIN